MFAEAKTFCDYVWQTVCLRLRKVWNIMKLIAAVDNHWAIGYKGQLLVSIRADQINFKKHTINNTVILGRKTLDTFPNGLPLPQRRNIILSAKKDYKVKNAEVVHSVDELLELVKDVNDDELFVIGGESIYRQLLPYCHEAIITKIDYVYQADAFVPNLDEDEDWECVEESEEMTCFDISFKYCKYIRKSAQKAE